MIFNFLVLSNKATEILHKVIDILGPKSRNPIAFNKLPS
jgi:hypothetical protein